MDHLIRSRYGQVPGLWQVRALNFKRGFVLLKCERRVNLFVFLEVLLRRDARILFEV